jgi:hypothetical protein
MRQCSADAECLLVEIGCICGCTPTSIASKSLDEYTASFG